MLILFFLVLCFDKNGFGTSKRGTSTYADYRRPVCGKDEARHQMVLEYYSVDSSRLSTRDSLLGPPVPSTTT